MASSGLKARLMLFEGGGSENTAMGADQKDSVSPTKAVPPVLQKFRQQQLQGGQSAEEPRPPVAQKPEGPKWGKGAATNSRQNGDSSGVSKPQPDAALPGTGASAGGVGKVNVALKFMQGEAPPALKPVVPMKKPSLATSNSEPSNKASSPEEEVPRPKVALKPPSKAWTPPGVNGVQKSPVASPTNSSTIMNDKPVPATPPKAFPGTASANNSFSDKGPVKLPAMNNKIILNKTDSSASSSSSANSCKSPTPSMASNNTNGPYDFRSKLKKTRPSLGDTAQVVKSDERDSKSSSESPADSTKNLPQSNGHEPDLAKRSSSCDDFSTEHIVERPSDRKRFKKVDLSSVPSSGAAPNKPSLPEGGVDLSLLCQQHANLLQGKSPGAEDTSPPAEDEVDDEDFYTDGMTVELRQTEPTSQSRESNRVSVIPEMSAEEEGFDVYDEGQSTSEVDLLYVDAASESKASETPEDQLEDIYEEESEFVEQPVESEAEKKKRLKEEEEAKKREKKKEEEMKKKKKQMEKKEREQRKKFNMTGKETSVGEGVIKEDAKGRNLLSVKKGQMVTIIRLDNNPANRWLVRMEDDVGYVDSSNIEIDPQVIRQIMLRSILAAASTPQGLEKSIAVLMAKDKLGAMGKKDSVSSPQLVDDEEDQLYNDVADDGEPQKQREPPEEEEEEEVYECMD